MDSKQKLHEMVLESAPKLDFAYKNYSQSLTGLFEQLIADVEHDNWYQKSTTCYNLEMGDCEIEVDHKWTLNIYRNNERLVSVEYFNVSNNVKSLLCDLSHVIKTKLQ